MDNVIRFSRPAGLSKYEMLTIVNALDVCQTAKDIFNEMAKYYDIERLRRNFNYIKSKHKDKNYYEDITDDELLSNNQCSYKGVF